ncbi:MAG: hypothetical protein COV45_07115 [Deltaproteobacteria bacterium CG11_big_fil_rev_8_21_14_0_20_47_16]|nr:MAG: hypothetical protein COV45_07115 [Deltaproteobacteria bacterium CG11_big_fil_rev_8_21_14_0_20_47_16]
MVTTSNNRIDPREIKATVQRSGKAQVGGDSFSNAMNAAGAMAPFVGEATAQTTGNVNAASVLHAAFTAMPRAYASSAGGYYGGSGMASGMDELGIMGASSFSTVNPGYASTGDAAGLGTSQTQLIDKMNSNNLELLGLQATLQNNMQSWTTKSNVLKSSYEAKMNMIQKFSVRG